MIEASESVAVSPSAVNTLPRPYYESGGITIYHGDCREILPDLDSVGLVVTDPLFYLPARISTSRKSWPRTLSEVAVMESYFRDAFSAIVGKLNRSGAFYTFCDSTSYAVFYSLLYPLFDRTQCIVWDKEVGGLGNGWRHSLELIVHGVWSGTEYAPGFRKNVISARTVPSNERHHASEKPLGLLAQLISAHPESIVLDPYMGSGSTLRAAKDLGRRAIGIDIEESNCEAAANRLSQEVLAL